MTFRLLIARRLNARRTGAGGNGPGGDGGIFLITTNNRCFSACGVFLEYGSPQGFSGQAEAGDPNYGMEIPLGNAGNPGVGHETPRVGIRGPYRDARAILTQGGTLAANRRLLRIWTKQLWDVMNIDNNRGFDKNASFALTDRTRSRR